MGVSVQQGSRHLWNLIGQRHDASGVCDVLLLFDAGLAMKTRPVGRTDYFRDPRVHIAFESPYAIDDREWFIVCYGPMRANFKWLDDNLIPTCIECIANLATQLAL